MRNEATPQDRVEKIAQDEVRREILSILTETGLIPGRGIEGALGRVVQDPTTK